MAPENLQEFIDFLSSNDEIRRVDAAVDPDLEIAAITDRVSKGQAGGRALLFENVRGHRFPVATNLFGSASRTARALGVESVEEHAERLAAGLAKEEGDSRERLLRLLASPDYAPATVADPPCRQQIEEEPDLSILPLLRSWKGDGGRFITLPMVFTLDPETGERNCGMYRVQIVEDNTAAVHWSESSDGARHYRAWSEIGERMPVAIAIGGDPAAIFAACAPLPSGIDELSFAGFLRNSPLRTARCLHSEIEVPAEADFVIEGYLEPGELRTDGAFGNHTGYYVPGTDCPVFRPTVLTRRKDAVYPCTLVGRPPMEDCHLAKATERIFLPLIRIDFPEIRDINMPMEGIFHGCTLVSMSAERPGHGRDLIQRLWEKGMLRFAKLLVILDADVDVQDLPNVFWRTINELDAARDLVTAGGRIGIDATSSGKGERVGSDPGTEKLLNERWAEYGLDR